MSYLYLHHKTQQLCFLLILIYLPTAHLAYNPTYPCRSNRPTRWERDPENCNKYYFCIYGRPILMPSCEPGLVWSQRGSACVEINSYWDDCKPSSIKNVIPTQSTTTLLRSHTELLTNRKTAPVATTRATTIQTSTRNPRIPADSPCLTQTGILPHPKNCHWYYNCSLNPQSLEFRFYEVFTAECPYPQLFDSKQLRCREFLNNKCHNRFEAVDPCEYRKNKCVSSHCQPCMYRYGSCRGRPDGIYPLRNALWTPRYVTCYYERAIAHDSCERPTPIFSPTENYCVSMDMVPKSHGGVKPDCMFRPNGFYPDEMGRCDVYFLCRDAKMEGFHKCQNGSVFNTDSQTCQLRKQVSLPCGAGPSPSCLGRQDGLYTDLTGRCSHYFECKGFIFKTFHKCPEGKFFSPYQQSCIKGIVSLIQPCGHQNNPCENRISGLYPHHSSDSHYIECHHGLLIHYGTCPNGHKFNASSRKCEPPAMQENCMNKADGRYKYPEAECLAFYECHQQKSLGVVQCTDNLNGTRFNFQTGGCDQPQNICPPCGYKWFNCPTYSTMTTR